MYEVGIVFKNGSKVTFDAEEFDINLARRNLVTTGDTSYSQVFRFMYTDAMGGDAPIYLNPDEVAGIAVVRTTDDTTHKRTLKVL